VKAVLESNYLNTVSNLEFEQRMPGLPARNMASLLRVGPRPSIFARCSGGGHGDEVIIPDITFIATANAASMAGATADPGRCQLETFEHERLCSRGSDHSRTKAVVPVHVSGRGADMENILRVCAQRGLAVVEDAAERSVRT